MGEAYKEKYNNIKEQIENRSISRSETDIRTKNSISQTVFGNNQSMGPDY